MRFQPPHCPHSDCPSTRPGVPFLYHRRGTYLRRCDGRRAQRFHCRVCRRSFSTQSFRLDYRLHKPFLNPRLFYLFASKVTQRQAARILGISRHTVAHRLILIGRHCRDGHFHALDHHRSGLVGTFQLDELETFETDRRLRPLTVPILIARSSYFVLHAACGTLPPRGGLRKRDRERKAAMERREGKRRNQSRLVVRECFEALARVVPRGQRVEVQTDRKQSYVGIARKALGAKLGVHQRESSRRKRNYGNPLFPINHTLAMARDGLSRLVRRSWGVSKKRSGLRMQLWIWMAYRNYVREIRVQTRETSAAMAVGLVGKRLRAAELLRWRGVFQAQDLH